MEDTPETPLVSSSQIIFTDTKKASHTVPIIAEQDEDDQDDHFKAQQSDEDSQDMGSLDCSGGAAATYTMTFCAGIKNLLIMIFIFYFWCWTSGNREHGMDVINQMCRDNQLNITFHTSGFEMINTWNSKQTLKDVERNQHIKDQIETYENGAMGHMPELKWQDTEECTDHYFKNGTLNNGCLLLSEDVWGATVKLMYAELGDKTFLLITIFTMAWSTWHLKENAEDIELEHEHEEGEEKKKETDSVQMEGGLLTDKDGEQQEDEASQKLLLSQSVHTDQKKYKGKFTQKKGLLIHEADENTKKFEAHTHTEQKIAANPLRIFLASSIGTCYVNWKSLEFQKQIRVNEVGLFVSISCVLILMFFLFGICNQHMQASNDLDDLRKSYEDKRKKLSKETIIDEFHRQEEQQKEAKRSQRDIVLHYRVIETQTKREDEILRIKQDKQDLKDEIKNMSNSEIESDGILQVKPINMIGFIDGTIVECIDSVLNKKEDEIEQQRQKRVIESKEAKEKKETKKKLKKEKKKKKMLEIDVNDGDQNFVERSMAFEGQFPPETPKQESVLHSHSASGFTSTIMDSQFQSSDTDSDDEAAFEWKRPDKLLIRKVIEFVKNFFYDLLFLTFIITQEIDDTSFITQIQLRASYTILTLQFACLLCHLIMNFLVIAVVFVYVGFSISLKESNLISMLVIYLICGFEFVNHVVYWTAQLLGMNR